MATKSIQRSLKLIKEYGWFYEITEHWNQYIRRRHDLFGFCDILCIDGSRIVAIQAMGADIGKHKQKMYENEFVIPWLKANNDLEMWAWRKLKKVRGKKATYWHCKKIDVLVFDGQIVFEERK